MFLGHYAVALAAKRAAPRVSLGALVLGAQFADLLWPILLLAGVEHVRIIPGLRAASAFDFWDYPISHSLLALAGWGAFLGLAWFALARQARGAVVIGLVVVSHWVLDWVMHRPDLPLWPWGGPKLGLFGWSSVPLTVALESVLFVAALGLYVRTTRPRDRIGRYALTALGALLAGAFAATFFTAPPPNERALAWGALGMWLLLPWAAWIDRHREPVQSVA